MYFWDEMTIDEVSAIIKAREKKEEAAIRVAWEQTRATCFYSVIAMQGTKSFKKPSDLFLFSWEKKEKKEKSLTKAEMLLKATKNYGEKRSKRRG